MAQADQKNMQRMSRKAFDALGQAERAAVMKRGCTLYDEPEPKRPVVLRVGEMTRADFEQLSNAERWLKIRAGIRVVD